MSDIQETNYSQMKAYVERQKWDFIEKEENGGQTLRIDVSHGKFKCVVKAYATGTIQIQGPQSKLKESLVKAKEAIENEEEIQELLPFEIEKFPETLKTNIPDIDPVIVRFIDEAIQSLKSNSLLGCAFLLGAASEKSILNLISAFGESIESEKNQEKFKSKTHMRSISRAYDEFRRSFAACKTKPQDFSLEEDLNIKIESIFQFCRICRNEVGHPQIVPNLDKGVILANMGQFVKYIESVYQLINFYRNNKTEL